ncbi:MAG: histidinol dehydrogenase [Treponema sp.]|nr:histidinol dehydrogenase [Treponema sp.]MBQ1713234.1 histidinol dehydrogenase [Treponema sp.]MBQ2206383.1 histidinol dehydrogenase [Treponema sp.]MBQ2548302.1 histidinol dehydrogenase [Treponema sp.]MBQ4024712.1 histidinol dehydrogenase [Treponema sp.]
MIKIQNVKDVEESFFAGRDFGDSIQTVRDVLKDVQLRGDQALLEYSRKFDLSAPATLEIPLEELKAAAQKMERENPNLYKSICYSHDLALRFAKKQRESFNDFETELEPGLFTGQKNIAVDRAGAYVPAGRFPLVSCVVMTITPAVAAGVKDIILCTPPRVHPDDLEKAKKEGSGIPGKPFVGGKPYADENIMAAAYICGATKVFAAGGSQAIAAMAFGTKSIPRADVIVGPGNKFVAEAKKLVYGNAGIDMIAGPTEVFVIADSSAKPEWVAADLLAQAEHDVVAQAVMATPDAELAKKVAEEIERQLELLPTKEIAKKSIEAFGRIIITDSVEQALELANKKAPEHLELAMEEGALRDKIQSQARNFGSLFIGHGSAEVFGDYAAGLNHTLPTSGSARFTGGLSVRVFLKTVTTLRTIPGSEGYKQSATAAGYLGDAEGLAAHAKAARLRLDQ